MFPNDINMYIYIYICMYMCIIFESDEYICMYEYFLYLITYLFFAPPTEPRKGCA